MKKTKNNNAITLLALVITIVIMLLLAAIAIQITIGENGLVAKSTEAKSQQIKAELYSFVEDEFTSLKLHAMQNKEAVPNPEDILTLPNFLERYTVSGNNILNKKNEIIDTKDNLINFLKKSIYKHSEEVVTEEQTTPPAETTPPVVTPPAETTPPSVTTPSIPGVAPEDINKAIFKLNIKDNVKLYISNLSNHKPMRVEIVSPDGTTEIISSRLEKDYTQGTYTLKCHSLDLYIGVGNYGNASIDILHWGNPNMTHSGLIIQKVDKVLYPEPELLGVNYQYAIFNSIPENLFSNKTSRSPLTMFEYCKNLTSIPAELFKKHTGVKSFNKVFSGCRNLTSIPEDLFKYSPDATNFEEAFADTGITSIPENLFKYNTNATNFMWTFSNVLSLQSIPENLFKYNTNAKYFNGTFHQTSIKSIPENLFKYNNKIENMEFIFSYCRNLQYIPQIIINKALSVSIHRYAFQQCTSASNYNSLPAKLQ